MLHLGARGSLAYPCVPSTLAEQAPDAVESLVVVGETSNVALGEARTAHPLLGPRAVEPLHEGGPVLERDEELRVGEAGDETATAQAELVDDDWVEQANQLR